MIIIYSFYFIAKKKKLSNNDSVSNYYSGPIYQYIINFFSSILLYTGICLISGITGSTNFIVIGQMSNNTVVSNAITIVFLAFLIKLGLGPWIFFKIIIYRSMNLQLTAIYTIIYTMCITIVFFNFIYIFEILIFKTTAYFLFFLISFCCVFFSSFSFQTPNILIFISYSTLINLSSFIVVFINNSIVIVWIAQE